MRKPRPEIPTGAPSSTRWFGGPVDRVSISLRVHGDTFDPDDVTTELGCAPTRCWRKGETVDGSDRTRTNSYWGLTVSSEEDGEWDLDELVRRLLERLSTDEGVWSRLQQRCKVDLFCGVFMEASNRGFGLSPGLCAMLAARGLEIGFDIYAPGP